MTSKRLKMCKKALVLFFAFLFSIESFAAVVSDNDGSAFVTKAEFEALKKDFEAQIDNYNESIDNRIDGAIASYLSGMQVKRKTELKNYYPLWNNGPVWRWSNNWGTRSEAPYGSAAMSQVACETKTGKKSTMDWSGVNAWTNNLFVGYGADHMIELSVYKWTGLVYDVTTHHYWQGAWRQNGSRTWYSYRGSSESTKPKRNGAMYIDYLESLDETQRTNLEAHIFAAYITESFSQQTMVGALSINRSAEEYFIQQSGDADATFTVVQANSVPASLKVGDFDMDAQQVASKWTPNWGKHHTHNLLRVKNWEDLTTYQERIISGAPVALIDASDNETDVEIKLKTDSGGKLYIYASKQPIAYNSLSYNNYTKQVDLTQYTWTTINLTDCPKDSWIRVAFLPDVVGSLATLTISSIIAEK